MNFDQRIPAERMEKISGTDSKKMKKTEVERDIAETLYILLKSAMNVIHCVI